MQSENANRVVVIILFFSVHECLWPFCFLAYIFNCPPMQVNFHLKSVHITNGQPKRLSSGQRTKRSKEIPDLLGGGAAAGRSEAPLAGTEERGNFL